MEKLIVGILFRKMLMLDKLEGEKDICHKLFQNYSNYRYLFLGPSKCGRTSLLFEYAFQTIDIHNNKTVLYIAQHKIEKLPNLIGERKFPPSTRKLKNIHIYYPQTFEECIQLLENFRLKEELFYDMIIVDDVDLLLEDSKKELTKNTAMLSAKLIDTVAYFSQKTGCNVMLLCSLNIKKNIYRYTSDILEIYFQNKIFFYPHHSRYGFSIKSETNAFSLLCDTNDVDVKNIYAKFDGDKIQLSC